MKKSTREAGPGRDAGVKAWMRWHARYGYARDIVKEPAKYLHAAARRRLLIAVGA